MKIIRNKYIGASTAKKKPIKASQVKYKKLKSKEVQDFDGWWTEYTLYYDPNKDYYFCILGDPDIYNTPEDADWEGQSEWEAYEWFDDYESYNDEDDDIYGAEEEPYDDGGAVRPQKYSSKDTAINWKYGRVPAIFKKIKWQPGTLNLDYGGGTPESGAIVDNFFANELGIDVTSVIYDKFNQPADANRQALQMVKLNGGADTCTLSNVLNVIAEPEVRHDILAHIKSLLKPNGVLYIYGYEGTAKDKGKGGRQTGEDQYQTFMPTKDYLAEIHEVFPNATIKSGLITAINDNSAVAASISSDDLVIL